MRSLSSVVERLLYTQKVVSSILTDSKLRDGTEVVRRAHNAEVHRSIRCLAQTPLAQLVERSAFNRNVVGSIPTGGVP